MTKVLFNLSRKELRKLLWPAVIGNVAWTIAQHLNEFVTYSEKNGLLFATFFIALVNLLIIGTYPLISAIRQPADIRVVPEWLNAILFVSIAMLFCWLAISIPYSTSSASYIGAYIALRSLLMILTITCFLRAISEKNAKSAWFGLITLTSFGLTFFSPQTHFSQDFERLIEAFWFLICTAVFSLPYSLTDWFNQEQ